MTRLTHIQGVTVLELRSRYDSLDFKALDEFSQTILTAADQADPPRLLLDLSNTDYIGSTVLELLLSAWRRLEQKEDGGMALCGVNPFCLEVLETTRLNVLWPIYNTRGEAVRDLAKP